MKLISIKKTNTFWYTQLYTGQNFETHYNLRKRLWITILGIPVFYIKEIFVIPTESELALLS